MTVHRITYLYCLAWIYLWTTASVVSAIDVPRDGYNEAFFQEHLQNAPIYPILVKVMGSIVVNEFPSFSSILDVGCGHGLLVEAWRSVGVQNSHGIEGSNAAASMWPEQYKNEFYQIQDLTDFESARKAIPQTDVVTTFEVGEHLPEEIADSFVQLLVLHRPSWVFFGAATVFQDRGKNPSHVNENQFRYWIDKFQQQSYAPDLVATATVRHLLIQDQTFRKHLTQAWWYPKNVWVFVEVGADGGAKQKSIDKKLIDHPSSKNMLDQRYLSLFGDSEFGQMWRRDWTEFGTIFYEEQLEARKRLALVGPGEL